MAMYQALYRKYRPTVFSDVVGQSHITRTLQKQVAEGHTSHAYLFTGSRGTGKTTCAKILSRAVNCENPQDGNPCGTCAACVALESGTSLDVLELDAASNNGVDQVRALRDEAVYPPANVRKRVYIVDEVHMLSVPAFNALLKILEEPPEHLIFILATTELHKVPATILSRCQRYSFRRIQPRDIAERLRYVAQRERIDLTDDGAELLARLAEGALRDGLSLLDQCAASGATVDAAAVLDTLGLAGNLQTARLLEHILRKDVPSTLGLFGELYDNGRDGVTVLRELAALIRDLLLQRMAPDGSAALLSGGYDARTLEHLESLSTVNRLLYLASTLQGVGAELSDGANSRLSAELYLLRLCDETLSGDLTALVSRIERLEAGQVPAPIPAQSLASAQPSAAPGTPPFAAPPVTPSPYAQPAPPGYAQPAPVAPPVRVPQAPAPPVRVSQAPAPDDTPSLDDMPPDNAPPWADTPLLDDVSWDTLLYDNKDVPPGDMSFFDEATPEYMLSPDKEPSEDRLPPNDAPFVDNAPQSAPTDTASETEESFKWDEVLERSLKRLNKDSYDSFLRQCVGILSGSTLTVYTSNNIGSLRRADRESVKKILREESGAKRVVVKAEDPPADISSEEQKKNVTNS